MAKKKAKALAKTKEKELVWAGAKSLLGKPKDAKEDYERKIILLTAKVLGVSPFGVNILGSLPYINKLGLAEKQVQYNPKATRAYNWIQFSKDDTDKAICQCKIVIKGGPDLCDWIVGECSPSTMKMGTLKGYQNHMAQTRARNRAILEVFGVRIHEEMMGNIQKMVQKEQITKEQATTMTNAVATSVEEIEPGKKKTQIITSMASNAGKILAGEKEKKDIESYCRELGADDPNKAYDLIKKLTGISFNEKLTKTDSLTIIAALLQKQTAKRNGKKN